MSVKGSFINVGQKEIPIYINGVSIEEYYIVTPVGGRGKYDKVPASIGFARRELCKYITAITGVPLSYGTENLPLIRKYEIVLGETAREGQPSNADCTDDEVIIKTVGTRLFINGGKRGVLYGVYTFLEKYCGVRFFAPTVEKMYDVKRIDIGDIDYKYKSNFGYRELCYWNAWDPDFSVKNKINGTLVRVLDDEHGNGMGWAGGIPGLAHTFAWLCPGDEYMKDHPEYFALDSKGVRRHMGLCLTNEGTLNAVVEHARKILKESKEKMISISINDGGQVYCTCEKCRAISPSTEDYAPQVIQFVCKVANALKDEFPDVIFDTLVYGKVVHAPKGVVIPDNVSVRLCGHFMRSELSEDGVTDGVVRFRKQIDEWSEIAHGLTLWDYPETYNVINSIFPVFHTFRKNAKYYADKKIIGMFINGINDSAKFSELVVYLIAKVLWEPYMTEEEYQTAMDEFLLGFYGKGWKKIKEFIEYTYEISNKPFFANVLPVDLINPFIEKDGVKKVNYALVKKLKGYFTDAMKVASQGEKYRLKKASIQADYWFVHSCMKFIMDNGTEQEKKQIIKENEELYNNLKKFGILRIIENCYLPVVTDFRQDPDVWAHWDPTCTFGEKNNKGTIEDIYAFIETDLPLGTKVDLIVDFKTSNNDKDCYVSVLGENGFITFEGADDKDKKPIWDNYLDYKPITFKNAIVTNLETFAKADGKDIKHYDYRFIPKYLNGFIIALKHDCPGGYMFVKNEKIEKKD